MRKVQCKLIKLFLKSHCEMCGNSEELELHHEEITHIELLRKCVEDLGYEYINKKQNYTEEELINIENKFLEECLKIKYKTLCKTCHIKSHGKTLKPKTKHIKINKGANMYNSKKVIVHIINDELDIIFNTVSEFKKWLIDTKRCKNKRQADEVSIKYADGLEYKDIIFIKQITNQ